VKSFGLIRTNVGLTTNIKIMVSSDYSLTLDSIDSTGELSVSKFKKKSFIEKNYWDELINYFWENTPIELSYFIKYENDLETMSNDYSQQYDELYYYGARNISNNKDYSEEFEYFAPLYISPNNLPKYFIIFRVDGPGISKVDKKNVKTEVFNKFKTVKLFDLTLKTSLGYWFDINFRKNQFFPKSPLEIEFNSTEFSRYNGIGYDTPGYISKAFFLESVYEEEKEIFEMEKYIFDGWKRNKIVFPNILNLSFLFDDTPADADTLRKWSINRYYGFYLDDLEKVSSFSPYQPPQLHSDVKILDNNIISSTYSFPFVEQFKSQKTYWVEYEGEYYQVQRYTKSTGRVLGSSDSFSEEYTTSFTSTFRIISDLDLKGKEAELNQNSGKIDSVNTNRLLNVDGTNFDIPEWNSADIWLIEIDGIYHNLVRETNEEIVSGNSVVTTKIRINTDWTFTIDENNYTYYVNKKDPTYTIKKSYLITGDNKPFSFPIYRVKFSDIKDFDDRIIDTNYSKFEYEKELELTETDETKMYLTNLDSPTEPRDLDDFTFKNEVVNIPVSSEYTVNWETFKITNGEMSEIWRRNPVYCRWGFQNSSSANDMPYLLNNSLVFEDYNRTTNTFDVKPSRIERNLDYFLTINSSTASYLYHSLHVENQISGVIDTSFKFELDKYVNLGTYSIGSQTLTYNYDYFSWFFEKSNYFNDSKIKTTSKKYSLFNGGDNSIPNTTLFRGVKYNLFEVSSINKNQLGNIEVLNLKNSNKYEGWKFSVLLSDNDWTIDWIDRTTTSKSATVSQLDNQMQWRIFDQWEMNKNYSNGDLVIVDDMIYESSIDNNVTVEPNKFYSTLYNTKSAPYNQLNWVEYTNKVFWNPTVTYPNLSNGLGSTGDIIYNYGDYWKYESSGTDDFWNPITSSTSGYNSGDIVLFKGRWWKSLVSGNQHRPDYNIPFLSGGVYSRFWEETSENNPLWYKVEIWSRRYVYDAGNYIIHNDILWYNSAFVDAGIEPGTTTDWQRVYSLVPDTDIIYDPTTNPIIEMNEAFYECTSNASDSTLENGINIYINEKWKNVLVNIVVSDNTIPNLSETDRDQLYNHLTYKLSAYNFIDSVNNLQNKNGFTDYVNYFRIDENDNIYKWNFDNIDGLPFILICENPDEFQMKRNSLTYTKIEKPSKLNPSKFATVINDDISNLNDWNGISPACEIKENAELPSKIDLYHGGRNLLTDVVHRFSGFYSPVFYEPELFSKDFFTSSVGNYKFDIDFTNFGILKERRIRKVNHTGTILNLQNVSDEKSIYPMLDEFGYTTIDFFLFKSTWDSEYLVKVDKNPTEPQPIINEPEINTTSVGIQVPLNNPSL
jgi:hypothetical protein